jgi:uncharacterized protein (DUF1778 family)
MTTSSESAAVLSVRVSPDEMGMLEAAARDSGVSVGEYVRQKSIEAAETEILNRSTVIIPAENWEAFVAWLERPPEKIPELVELSRRAAPWDD